MQRYCETDICRRRILLSYFGEEVEKDCGNCDVCKNPPLRFDGSILVQKALSAVVRTQQQIGIEMLIHILRGAARAELTEKGFHLIKTYGAGRDLSYVEWKEYIYQMIQLGFLEIDYAHANRLKVTPLGTKVLYGKTTAQLTKYMPPEPEKKKTKTNTGKKGFKAQPIRRESRPAYHIFTDDSLEDMVAQKPITLGDFNQIRGVGQIKLEKYGRVFVSLIRFVLKLPKLEG